MKTYFTLFTLLTLALATQADNYAKAKKQTQKIFDKALKNPAVHNAVLNVYSPSHAINWSFAGGQFQSGEEVTDAHPFYTASIGKTFTATAIALLYERGKLHFSDRIASYLSDSIIGGLHVYKGVDYSKEITIAQLLQHTSGLPDYFEDNTIDGSPNAMTLLFTHPQKFFTPYETIAMAKNHMSPNFAPGNDYHYSDTEYILLGMIVEKISGMQFHDFLRKNIFEPLAMHHTYMHLRSAPVSPTVQMTELYAGESEISSFKSLSLDWAGGGLVATTNELNTFQMALHTHEILKAETITQMEQWTPESKGMFYGYGLRKVALKELFPTLPNLQLIGHTGSTASFMFYCPELDVYLSGTLNQVSEVKKSVMIPVNVLTVLNQHLQK